MWYSRAEDHQDRDRERDVGRHRDRPPTTPGTAGIDRREEQRGDDHPAECSEYGETRIAAIAQLTADQLTLDLQTDHEEEHGHQAVVDPMTEVFGQRESSPPERQVAAPEVVVGPARRVGPHERGQGRSQQHGSAERLDGDEVAPERRQCATDDGDPKVTSHVRAFVDGETPTPTRLPGTPPTTLSRERLVDVGISSEARATAARTDHPGPLPPTRTGPFPLHACPRRGAQSGRQLDIRRIR